MPALVLLFFLADCALIVPYLIAWEMDGLYWKLGALVDLRGKANLVSWYASVQLFLIAVLLGVFAYYKLDRRNRASWLLLLLPFVFAAMSFEEIADIHDWLAYKRAMLFPLGCFARDMLYYRDLTLIGVPLLVALLVTLGLAVRPYLRDRPATTWKFLAGLVVFVACGAELLSGTLAPGSTSRVLVLSLEKLGELTGMTLMLWATHDLLVSHALWLPTPAAGSLRPTTPTG